MQHQMVGGDLSAPRNRQGTRLTLKDFQQWGGSLYNVFVLIYYDY